MTEHTATPDRTFTVATDNSLSDLIFNARDRILFIAPGITKPVATALVSRLADPRLSITVILDSDPEVYRLGFGMSRRQARQLVRHGHVQVNGRKVNIPSYEVSVGEEIAIREGSRKLPILEQAKEFASHQNAPTWLEIDRDNSKGRVLSLPKREEIQMPVNEQLIVELYSK